MTKTFQWAPVSGIGIAKLQASTLETHARQAPLRQNTAANAAMLAPGAEKEEHEPQLIAGGVAKLAPHPLEKQPELNAASSAAGQNIKHLETEAVALGVSGVLPWVAVLGEIKGRKRLNLGLLINREGV